MNENALLFHFREIFNFEIKKLENQRSFADKEEDHILIGKITGYTEAFNIIEKELRR